MSILWKCVVGVSYVLHLLPHVSAAGYSTESHSSAPISQHEPKARYIIDHSDTGTDCGYLAKMDVLLRGKIYKVNEVLTSANSVLEIGGGRLGVLRPFIHEPLRVRRNKLVNIYHNIFKGLPGFQKSVESKVFDYNNHNKDAKISRISMLLRHNFDDTTLKTARDIAANESLDEISNNKLSNGISVEQTCSLLQFIQEKYNRSVELGKLETEHEKLKIECENLQNKLNVNIRTLKQERDAKTASNKKVDALNSEINELKSEKISLEKLLGTSAISIESMKSNHSSEIKKMEAEVEKLGLENSKIQKSLEESDIAKKKIENNLKSTIEEMKVKVQDLNDRNIHLQESLETSIKLVESMKSDHKSKIEEMGNIVEKLRSDNSDLHQSLETFNSLKKETENFLISMIEEMKHSAELKSSILSGVSPEEESNPETCNKTLQGELQKLQNVLLKQSELYQSKEIAYESYIQNLLKSSEDKREKLDEYVKITNGLQKLLSIDVKLTENSNRKGEEALQKLLDQDPNAEEDLMKKLLEQNPNAKKDLQNLLELNANAEKQNLRELLKTKIEAKRQELELNSNSEDEDLRDQLEKVNTADKTDLLREQLKMVIEAKQQELELNPNSEKNLENLLKRNSDADVEDLREQLKKVTEAKQQVLREQLEKVNNAEKEDLQEQFEKEIEARKQDLWEQLENVIEAEKQALLSESNETLKSLLKQTTEDELKSLVEQSAQLVGVKANFNSLENEKLELQETIMARSRKVYELLNELNELKKKIEISEHLKESKPSDSKSTSSPQKEESNCWSWFR